MELKPGYRYTEVGVIPEDWEVKSLGQLFTFQNGVNADKAAYGSGVPFVNVLEVITHSSLKDPDIPGKVTLTARAIDTFSVQPGDVLFNRTSETQEEVGLASVYVGTEAVVFGGFVIRARPQASSMDSGFSAYALRSPHVRSQIVARGQGAIRANIGQQELARVQVALPSEAEQEAISEALSDADALIDSLEQLLVKKRQLKQGAMQELLTGRKRLPGYAGEWEVQRLGDLGLTFGGLTGKRKVDFAHGAGRYITFMNIMSNVVIDCSDLGHVDVEPTESQNRVANGDLFFNGSSETPEDVGMCAVLKEDIQDVFLNSFCFGFRFHQGVAAEGSCFAYYFRSLQGRDLLRSLAQGATRYNLSKTALLKLRFPLPRHAEQVAIAGVLSDVDAGIAALEDHVAKTRQLKLGMMQELLAGGIRLPVVPRAASA